MSNPYHKIDDLMHFINDTKLNKYMKDIENVVAPKYIVDTYNKIITTIKKEHEIKLEKSLPFTMSSCIESMIKKLVSWDINNENAHMLVASSYVKTREHALATIVWYLMNKKNDPSIEYDIDTRKIITLPINDFEYNGGRGLITI